MTRLTRDQLRRRWLKERERFCILLRDYGEMSGYATMLAEEQMKRHGEYCPCEPCGVARRVLGKPAPQRELTIGDS